MDTKKMFEYRCKFMPVESSSGPPTKYTEACKTLCIAIWASQKQFRTLSGS